jgi:hypothetical protein
MSDEFEPSEISEDLESMIDIDPLQVASEMAAIIYNVGETEILNVTAKQECIEDCMDVIYLCNTIIKAQIKEQYPVYFKKKKNAKASNTIKSAKDEQAETA